MPPDIASPSELFTKIKHKMMESESVNVYELVPPDKIVKHEELIVELLFGMKSSNENNKTFYISPASGCLSFADHNELYNGRDPTSLPKDSKKAEMFAMNFLQDKNDGHVKRGYLLYYHSV